MSEKVSEVNRKYGFAGLLKIEDVTTINGAGIENLPKKSVEYLANYGLFVLISRLTANEKDTSKWADLFTEKWTWLMEEMPKIDRTRTDVFTTSCNKIMASEGAEKNKLAAIKALENAFGRIYEKEAKAKEVKEVKE